MTARAKKCLVLSEGDWTARTWSRELIPIARIVMPALYSAFGCFRVTRSFPINHFSANPSEREIRLVSGQNTLRTHFGFQSRTQGQWGKLGVI